MRLTVKGVLKLLLRFCGYGRRWLTVQGFQLLPTVAMNKSNWLTLPIGNGIQELLFVAPVVAIVILSTVFCILLFLYIRG